jgi:hypothetical protein
MRQVIDYGLFFDRDHLEEKKFIEDLLFVSCMNPKAGSFPVDTRLQRQFTIFSFGAPDSTILKSIYGQILAAGKQSLSRLAAFIIGCEAEQVVVTSSYKMNDLKTFLQELFKKCVKSSAGSPRVFMLTDSQITRKTFLVYINDLPSQSHIPDLFPKEEEEGLIQGLRN